MRPLALALAVVGLATVPFWVGGTYYINVSSQILLFGIFALGVNVLVGYAGLARSATRDYSASRPTPGRDC